MDRSKILRIKVPRKPSHQEQKSVIEDISQIQVPKDDESSGILLGDLDPGDEKALKSLKSQSGRLMLYTSNGESVSLENWYRNNSAFLMLSGPSLNSYDLSQLGKRGIVTMGVNNSWAIYKPNLWVSVDDPGNFIDVGWKDPSIIKFCPMGSLNRRLVVKEGAEFRNSQFRTNDMPAVFYYRRNGKFNAETFLTENSVNWGNADDVTDHLGWKGSRSVMLSALRLLYYLGFREVYLLGADFKMEFGSQNYAFQQDRHEGSVKGNNSIYRSLNDRFAALQPRFIQSNFKVYNCYEESGLRAFPHLSFSDAIARASRTCSKAIDTEGWYDRKHREREAQKAAVAAEKEKK